jgi:RNA polymerase sigma-70 factor (ECF subfamily)
MEDVKAHRGPWPFVKESAEALAKGADAASQEATLADLLRLTSAADRVAFATLYEKTAAKLFGIVRRICISDETAQEALQETYLLIWRNAGSFDPRIASPITWMARIARNKAIDIRRLQSERISALGVQLDLEAPSPEADAHAVAEKNEALRRLMECLSGLPKDRREMILLAYYNGLTREEIGGRFDRPTNTVKTLIRRSLLRLKECLDGHGD